MSDVGSIHREIIDLKARSLLAVDEKRWDDFAGCFTDDARIDYSRAAPAGSERPAPVIPSVEAYARVAAAHIADAKTMHLPSIPVIQVLGPDRAKATWKMEEVFVRPAGSERASHRGYFLYEDEYRLTADGWRISALTFIPWFTTRLDHE